MKLSVFDMFSIGVGPSSSHTVGPMRAAYQFINQVKHHHLLEKVHRVEINLYGSLALTGKGHATDKAVLLGLMGNTPEEIISTQIDSMIDAIRQGKNINLLGLKQIPFYEERDLLFNMEVFLELHSNGVIFSVYDGQDKLLLSEEYYSIGGGFILTQNDFDQNEIDDLKTSQVPHPFQNSADILRICQEKQISMKQLIFDNELTWRSEDEINQGLLKIWHVMRDCVKRGCETEGILPGGLNVKRRAKNIYEQLKTEEENGSMKYDPAIVKDWISLFALAVNEENAAGGKVVTAPTNGAAGVIPAVLSYVVKFYKQPVEDKTIIEYLLVAGLIGMLFKMNASISAAEVGCQGEIGVACAMAAAGVASIKGGTPNQICNAAEIGMEHHLGMTCDPIGGLVQIPCIERNAFGANSAINAARLAMRGDGEHIVSLDTVIQTMYRTGKDMSERYKETSLAGLAVNHVAC